MREKIESISKPSLGIHIEYDYLTAGELGNIFIRLQAALRALSGLSPGEYSGEYSKEKPRIIVSSVNTGKSIDVSIVISIVALAMSAPGALEDWTLFTKKIFKLFKALILAIPDGKVRNQQGHEIHDYLSVKVTRGEIDVKRERTSLDALSNNQIQRVTNFLWSLTGPAKKVVIKDEDTEITIEWSGEDHN